MQIEELKREKAATIRTQEFEKAAEVRDRIRHLEEDLEKVRSAWEKEGNLGETLVTEEDVAYVMSKWTGIPLSKLEKSESEKLQMMKQELHKRVVGQDQAIGLVSEAIRRSRAGINDPRKPLGSFMFFGPTGVGKTELARALAEFLFEDEDAIIRVDMSEYMEKFSTSRLVGAPPGYVGHDEAPQLTEKVRRKPYAVVLFDEIEKAHPDVLSMLLQVLEDGRLTDSSGRTVDFKNTIIIMTSNEGGDIFARGKKIGLGPPDQEKKWLDVEKEIQSLIKKRFNPEFLNRVDEIVVFHQLNEAHVKEIVGILIGELNERLKHRGASISLNDKVLDYLVKEGFDTTYGARQLKRVIQRRIENPLADELLKKSAASDKTIEEIRAELIRPEKEGDKPRIVFRRSTKRYPKKSSPNPVPA